MLCSPFLCNNVGDTKYWDKFNSSQLHQVHVLFVRSSKRCLRCETTTNTTSNASKRNKAKGQSCHDSRTPLITCTGTLPINAVFDVATNVVVCFDALTKLTPAPPCGSIIMRAEQEEGSWTPTQHKRQKVSRFRPSFRLPKRFAVPSLKRFSEWPGNRFLKVTPPSSLSNSVRLRTASGSFVLQIRRLLTIAFSYLI